MGKREPKVSSGPARALLPDLKNSLNRWILSDIVHLQPSTKNAHELPRARWPGDENSPPRSSLRRRQADERGERPARREFESRTTKLPGGPSLIVTEWTTGLSRAVFALPPLLLPSAVSEPFVVRRFRSAPPGLD